MIGLQMKFVTQLLFFDPTHTKIEGVERFGYLIQPRKFAFRFLKPASTVTYANIKIPKANLALYSSVIIFANQNR